MLVKTKDGEINNGYAPKDGPPSICSTHIGAIGKRGWANSIAYYSTCKKYRFYLGRAWDYKLPLINYIMLNPSTATEKQNDPTVDRCHERARMMGYGSFVVTNAFAWRSTHPTDLFLPAVVPHVEGNDFWIDQGVKHADKVVIAWGNHATFLGRDIELVARLEDQGIEMFCFGQNASGTPKHPLYLKYDLPLMRFVQSVI